jgi:hypothetical protein
MLFDGRGAYRYRYPLHLNENSELELRMPIKLTYRYVRTPLRRIMATRDCEFLSKSSSF